MQTAEPHALVLESFGVAFGEQVILGDVSFELPVTGLNVLVGPAGGGKSTLLRTLAGLNDAHPSLVTWGCASFGGRADQEASLGSAGQRPALVMQQARFFLDSVRENLVSALPNRSALERPDQLRIVTSLLQNTGLDELVEHLERNAMDLPLGLQRRLAFARALVPNPRVLFADEPTVGLSEEEIVRVIELLRLQARTRAVLLVTHNQRVALAAGGNTLLLAGGKIQERAPTERFFTCPESEIAKRFLRTGGCVTTNPERPSRGPAQNLVPGLPVQATIVQSAQSRFLGPRNFFWVIPGRLGGLPRPGIIDELEQDLEGLERLGISVLVTLEETRTVTPAALAAFGIRSVHVPIADMAAPDVEAAIALCLEIDGWLRAGDVVAMHCLAGHGRTGTMLVCQLICMGEPPLRALEAVRAINPRCVQSTAQVEFLRVFADRLKATSFARKAGEGPQVQLVYSTT